jgi:hypothetical protein
MFQHLSDWGAEASIPTQNKSVLHVRRREVTACFTSAFAASRYPTKVLLNHSKETEVTGPTQCQPDLSLAITRLVAVTGYDASRGSHWLWHFSWQSLAMTLLVAVTGYDASPGSHWLWRFSWQSLAMTLLVAVTGYDASRGNSLQLAVIPIRLDSLWSIWLTVDFSSRRCEANSPFCTRDVDFVDVGLEGWVPLWDTCWNVSEVLLYFDPLTKCAPPVPSPLVWLHYANDIWWKLRIIKLLIK